jgi:hypothetical protein
VLNARPTTRRRPRLVMFVAGVATIATACQTGERPTYIEPTDSTVPAYADLFDTSSAVAETIVYRIEQTFQQIPATAVLSRDASRFVLDVRNTQYRDSDGERLTCNRDSKECQAGHDEQRISDLSITTGFWGPTVHQRLSGGGPTGRIGPVTTSREPVGDQTATCVSVPGPDRTDRYCALDSGVLASMDTAAVTIELVERRPGFDESLWGEIPSD